jgi:Protein of unknown function (DUF3592)
MVAIGVAVFVGGAIATFLQYAVVKYWLPTRGEVVKSQVENVTGPNSPTRYQPEVEFRYTVDGREFVSKTVPTSNAGSYPAARQLANSYSRGSQHVIRYDPANPADIRANAGYTLDFFLGPIAAMGLGLAFIFIPLWAFRAEQTSSKWRNPSRGMRLIGGVFAAVGLGLISVGSWTGYSIRTAKPLPAVNAQVSSSQVRHYVYTGGRSHRDIDCFEAIIEFRYSVAGQGYLSPSSESCITSSTEANQALALYAQGSLHEIRYNPADPNEIVFSRDSNPWIACYIFLGIGVVFVLLGGTCLMVQVKSTRPYQQKYR